ncbi:hypothetical protein EEL30_00015 (plasmid) [Brevibacillus laterosporus]|uniref:DNA-binding protein n=1 Tax=Brevibacillus laterosporus TaxID=1465 RepID=A0A518V1P2_BRELA|nr:hypothetical protein EEL30_00015 [Brevibacillus laterosporus]
MSINEKPKFTIDEVMTTTEAAKRYPIKLDTLNHAITRGQLDDLIEKGLIRKTTGSRSPWLVTPLAVEEYLKRKKY